jgi:hypothetical protein
VLADGGVGEPCEKSRRLMVRNGEKVGPQGSKSPCCSSGLGIWNSQFYLVKVEVMC